MISILPIESADLLAPRTASESVSDNTETSHAEHAFHKTTALHKYNGNKKTIGTLEIFRILYVLQSLQLC